MKRTIRNVDLNLLVVFGSLLETRNVSKTSKILNLSQSAVSGILKRLRETFEDELFVRQQRGLLPTQKALQLEQPIRVWLLQTETLFRPQEFIPEKTDRIFSVAATDYIQTTLLPYLSENLNKLAPNAKLRVLPVNHTQNMLDLENGELDFLFSTFDMAPQHLRSKQIYSESYVVAMSKNHPLAGRTLSIHDFVSFPHILVSPTGGSLSSQTDAILQTRGEKRNVFMSTPSFAAVPSLLSTTQCLSVLPERMANMSESLTIAVPPIDIKGFSIILAWHERNHGDPALHWFKDQILQINEMLGS
ncbi:LysR family transcriptional regulator [Marinibactrum halimedae]|uniref:LysR family transcriptional regulator n=1 Tax=Marinibactrum halimedae TaxID=1444977 RepID=A0AA37T5L7_9GAMM|nr:LysR family transcriptional regulator [Marinibactrum halimedae]MCD9461154.1 LysR family transcriptional regulator [Marinibactrum halimedae]GLS26041.1 LysR family transcriptional regulator [Marinibactrum halimedae]